MVDDHAGERTGAIALGTPRTVWLGLKITFLCVLGTFLVMIGNELLQWTGGGTAERLVLLGVSEAWLCLGALGVLATAALLFLPAANRELHRGGACDGEVETLDLSGLALLFVASLMEVYGFLPRVGCVLWSIGFFLILLWSGGLARCLRIAEVEGRLQGARKWAMAGLVGLFAPWGLLVASLLVLVMMGGGHPGAAKGLERALDFGEPLYAGLMVTAGYHYLRATVSMIRACYRLAGSGADLGH